MTDDTSNDTSNDISDLKAAEFVKAQAPRLFAAIVTKLGEDASTIIGWGMEFKDSTAYMVSADGRNQYFLAEAENALMYIRSGPDVVPDIVWVSPVSGEAEVDA
ncbi:hypothetical protein [Kibdelosporangium phytohabitans]|uniref:Uncharacterized protein n=1 Tax=Kibdelosporangium phytohabitans TaxID=860235 RepID=A0A0N9ICQ1_9PSEU|nr:hypothetical protein [Kibdelosporangium phytohabitans]ALG14197.1 hypothetical protein AOZ06_51560 [Kibdelosporangium phytohabitans]MBE1466809.1 hypothetical protein [Kibdelosporangium phytohabitans]